MRFFVRARLRCLRAGLHRRGLAGAGLALRGGLRRGVLLDLDRAAAHLPAVVGDHRQLSARDLELRPVVVDALGGVPGIRRLEPGDELPRVRGDRVDEHPVHPDDAEVLHRVVRQHHPDRDVVLDRADDALVAEPVRVLAPDVRARREPVADNGRRVGADVDELVVAELVDRAARLAQLRLRRRRVRGQEVGEHGGVRQIALVESEGLQGLPDLALVVRAAGAGRRHRNLQLELENRPIGFRVNHPL